MKMLSGYSGEYIGQWCIPIAIGQWCEFGICCYKPAQIIGPTIELPAIRDDQMYMWCLWNVSDPPATV